MQTLYQIDARGEGDMGQVELSVGDAPYPQAVQVEAMELARKAWEGRARSDELTNELAPEWPTHRQPPVDRAIIRLAFYEMASGMTPPAVAINEAIELSKVYGSEKTPAFVNGVLDRMATRLKDAPPPTAAVTDEAAPAATTTNDPWLADALHKARPTT